MRVAWWGARNPNATYFEQARNQMHITQLDPLYVGSRLEELAELKPGWLDGKGLALNPKGLQTLVRDFDT